MDHDPTTSAHRPQSLGESQAEQSQGGQSQGEQGQGEQSQGEEAQAGQGQGEQGQGEQAQGGRLPPTAERDLADVPAAEVIATTAVHLMSAAAVKTGLGEEGAAARDLDEARKLITALAGLVTAARPDLGFHAAPLRDGLQALQRAFREASTVPDEPGEGPGERLTGRF